MAGIKCLYLYCSESLQGLKRNPFKEKVRFARFPFIAQYDNFPLPCWNVPTYTPPDTEEIKLIALGENVCNACDKVFVEIDV